MEIYNINYELVKETQRHAEEKAEKFALVKQAELGDAKSSRSKILVKLAGILIDAGLRLKNYAEKDLKNNLQIPSLQDL